jgi:hypothetical protein
MCGGSARRAGKTSRGRCERGLGRRRCGRGCATRRRSAERLEAARHNLGACRRRDGEYAEAERIEREVLPRREEAAGTGRGASRHCGTLASASNLALSLSGQGKYADAERINRE